MASIAFSNVMVPAGTTNKDLQFFMVHPKTGNITFRFTGVPDRDIDGVVKKAPDLSFNIFESDDRASWGSALNTAGVVTVKNTGEAVVTVRSQKRFIKIAGFANGKNGLAKVEVTFQGSQFFGQIDIMVDQKKDGFPSTGQAASAVSSSPWPASSLS